MDNALTALFSIQFILFGLMLASLTWIGRKIIEYLIKNKTLQPVNIWNDLVLPVAPIILGALIGLIATKYPYPSGVSVVSGRVAFGLAAGLISSLLYRLIKSFIKSRISPSEDNDQ